MTCLDYVLFYKSVFAITQGLQGSQYATMEQQHMQTNEEFKCPLSLYQLTASREMENVSSYFGTAAPLPIYIGSMFHLSYELL